MPNCSDETNFREVPEERARHPRVERGDPKERIRYLNRLIPMTRPRCSGPGSR